MSKGLYVNYGCGTTAPKEWLNYDISPTLRLQKLPLLGPLFRARAGTKFPRHIRYGDITKGLPGVPADSCKGLFCSHVLEHLSLEDFRRALKQSYRILEPGGVFRLVVPDLEILARGYMQRLKNADPDGASWFMRATLLGKTHRPRGLRGRIRQAYGNSDHLWMWDRFSMEKELQDAGFTRIRICAYQDADDPMFNYVEDEDRFRDALAMEARKA